MIKRALKLRNLLLMGLAVSLTIACEKEDDNEPDNTGDDNSYNVPETYSFTDEDGNSTVSYSGQIDRLNQLEEMTALIKSANEPGTSVNFEDLKAMYRNVNGDGGGNFSFTSGKELRNKTAMAYPADSQQVRNDFEDVMEDMATVSQTTVSGEYDGGPGTAGVVQGGENDKGPYLMDENGREYAQIVEKGLMGAVFYHQITSVYLDESRIGDQVNNSEPVDPDNGKYYTDMEHHWDEAFGYFTTATDFPQNGTDRFWGKYCDRRDALLGCNETIMNAFLTGRAAIANDDMSTKEEMADVIKSELERVSAATAISYLNAAMDDFSIDVNRNHVLSEAVEFIEALRYSTDASISPVEVNQILDIIGDNYYQVTFEEIRDARDELSAKFNMDDIKEEL